MVEAGCQFIFTKELAEKLIDKDIAVRIEEKDDGWSCQYRKGIKNFLREKVSNMKMLDLFSGLGGASQAMGEDPNWEVTTVDFKEKFEPDICADVLDLGPRDFKEDYDLIWASPPCTYFTIARIWDYWTKGPDGKKFSPQP